MNLIEQLGGYEEAKITLFKRKMHLKRGTYFGFQAERVKEIISKIESALLEHRRQHNIFEVGDKVVLKRPDQFSEIYTYDAYSEKMDLHFFESESDYGHVALDRVRHATDAEIKAGRRLEVKSDNGI